MVEMLFRASVEQEEGQAQVTPRKPQYNPNGNPNGNTEKPQDAGLKAGATYAGRRSDARLFFGDG